MNGAWLRPGEPAWARVLERYAHDFHHLPDYVALSARWEGARPLAFHVESSATCLVPLLEREIPASRGSNGSRPLVDLASPYGYPGPLVSRPDDARAVEDGLRAFIAAARARGAISAFVRLHPMLPLPMSVLQSLGTVVDHGPTVVVDLRPPLEVVSAGMRKQVRYDIRRLRRAGYTTSVDDWTRLPDFVRLYRETMRRVGASPHYLYDAPYIDDLRLALGSRLHLIAVLGPEGGTVAAGLITISGAVAQYHLSGSDAATSHLGPTKLLIDRAIAVARELGAERLHLGGGVGGREDSLFAFKAGFSRDRAMFRTWRVVLDEDRYRALTERSGLAREAEVVPHTGFFPAYRVPADDPSASPQVATARV